MKWLPKKDHLFCASLASHLLQHVDAGLAERGAAFGLVVEVLHKGADCVLDRCGLERVQGAVIVLLKNNPTNPTRRKEEAHVFVCVVLSFRLFVFFLGGLSLCVCPEPVSANDIAPGFLY